MEDKEGADSAPSAGIDPSATTLALAGASRAEADAFLRDQRKLINLQAQELSHELGLRHWSLWVRHASGLLKLGLELSAGLLLLALVAGLGIMVWNASRAEGLVVETFSVPPSLAAAGITGEAISEDVTDHISDFRASTEGRTYVTNGSIRQDRGEDIKVEIPETGVSLTQVWRTLKSWLGSERHLRGSLRPDGDGRIRLAVALDGETSASFSGPTGDLEKIEQQAAEHVYALVESTNYLLYLNSNGRGDEALAAAAKLAEAARTPEERGYRYGMWAEFTQWVSGDFALAMTRIRLSIAADPTASIGYLSAWRIAALLSHQEDWLRRANEILSIQERDQWSSDHGGGSARMRRAVRSARDEVQGDYAAYAVDTCDSNCAYSVSLLANARAAAQMHDPTGSRTLIAQALAAGSNSDWELAFVRTHADMAARDWKTAIRDAGAYEAAVDARKPQPGYKAALKLNNGQVWLAEATAQTGDSAGGETLIAATPLDCDACVLVRGRIAALKHDWAGAARWFAMVSARTPHIPFADSDWGAMLLARGKPDDAIEKFKLANQKGPHFADPLEGWGEALMAKNQSHLALAKFAQAEKYAPNWGRLHLKWGEALAYSGKKDDAAKQFTRAATLDLTPSEKSELAGMRPHV